MTLTGKMSETEYRNGDVIIINGHYYKISYRGKKRVYLIFIGSTIREQRKQWEEEKHGTRLIRNKNRRTE